MKTIDPNTLPGILPLPDGAEERVFKGFKKYLFFRTVKRGVRDYVCSACKGHFTEGVMKEVITPTDLDLWRAPHNSERVCPLCGETSTVKNLAKINQFKFNQVRCIAYLIADKPDDVWFRCVAYTDFFDNCTEGNREAYEPMTYHLTPGKAEMWKDGERHEKFTDPFIWPHGLYVERYDFEILPVNLHLKDTFLRYSGYDEYNHFYINQPFIPYLCWYAIHPQIEMLAKTGNRALISQIVSSGKDTPTLLDWSSTTPWGLMRISKEVYKALQGNLTLWRVLAITGGKTVKDIDTAKEIMGMVRGNLVECRSFIGICKRSKISTKSATRYLQKVVRKSSGGCWQCPGITAAQAYDEWRDYMSMAENSGVAKNPFPTDLKAAHDAILASTKRKEAEKRVQDEIALYQRQAAEMEIAYPGVKASLDAIREKFSYREGAYEVKVPAGIFDIIREGSSLGHCVGRVERYYDRIQRGESYILFLREVEDQEAPYYTLEVEPDGTIRQKRTYEDRQDADIEKITAWLTGWQKAVAARMGTADKLAAKESRRQRIKEIAELRKTDATIRFGVFAGQKLADVLDGDLILAPGAENEIEIEVNAG